jgi:acetyltransferase-like isoleucine patch superfamily enzyme
MKAPWVFTREWRWCLAKLLRYIQIPSFERSQIHRSSRVGPRSTLIESTMARHSSCGFDCTIVNADIGPFVDIADRVSIGAPQHPTQWVSISEVFYKPGKLPGVKYPIERNRQLRCTIAPDCWIGAQSVIMPGVHVGLGAVIGANAVVTSDVAPYSIVGGVPARLIRMRFDEPIARKLMASNWWELDEATLASLAPHAESPEDFLMELARHHKLGVPADS